jgi:hypothetical protein
MTFVAGRHNRNERLRPNAAKEGKREKPLQGNSQRSKFMPMSITPSSPTLSLFLFFIWLDVTISKRVALQALLARLASSDRLPSHGAVGCNCLLLLNGARARALGTHRPGTGERATTAGTTHIDHAGGSQLRGCGGLWCDL